MILSQSQLATYERDGFLIVKDFFKPEPLLLEACNLLQSFDIDSHPKIKFTVGDDNHVTDEYFLTSGNKICYFLEEKIDLNSIFDRSKAINKIGHALHGLNPIFSEFSKNQKVCEIAFDLGYRDPRILQSMLIFKQPKIGGAVPGHVDSTFLYTDPPSATGMWFALEDCTISNGCLYFAPGSHKIYPLCKRFVRTNDGKTKIIYLDTDHDKKEPDDSEYVAAPVNAGDLVLIHGMVYHKSGPNLSEKSRWIYTFHVIEGELPYPKENWLLETEPFCSLPPLQRL